MSAEEKWIASQDDVLNRLAYELKSGQATNAISGMVKQGDFDVIQTWTLRSLGYTGESLERARVMVKYNNDFGDDAWGYLLEKHLLRASHKGVSGEEAKKKFIATIKKGYEIISALEEIFDKNERAKKEKASKEHREKPQNKKWYQ